MRRVVVLLLLLLSAVVLIIQVGMRFGLSHDAELLNVDPLEVTRPDSSNFDLIVPPDSPVFDASAKKTEDAVMTIMSSLPRTDKLAESGAPPRSTWVTTSLIWAFPDYTSIRVIPLDDGTSTVAIFARARFGDDDVGVNAERTAAILQALQAALDSE